MRILLHVTLPHDRFAAALKAGTASATMQRILAEQKPEAVYFTELAGKRSALLFLDLPSASAIPALAEPWFLAFGADVQLHPVMRPEDLAQANLDALAKKWL
jgi:hypothetical protein